MNIRWFRFIPVSHSFPKISRCVERAHGDGRSNLAGDCNGFKREGVDINIEAGKRYNDLAIANSFWTTSVYPGFYCMYKFEPAPDGQPGDCITDRRIYNLTETKSQCFNSFAPNQNSISFQKVDDVSQASNRFCWTPLVFFQASYSDYR